MTINNLLLKKINMEILVTGDQPFKVVKTTMTIGPSAGGYTLAYGVDRYGTFTNYTEAVPAGEACIVNGITPYTWFKLVGNSGPVKVVL